MSGMDYVDYPSPKTIEDAIDHLKNGGELWIKYFDGDCPDEDCEETNNSCKCCYGAFIENFEGEDRLFQSVNEEDLKRMHLIPV